MERRTLLRQLLWGIPAGMVLPSLLTSCKEDAFLGDNLFKGKVIVIGAGASGIYAAHLLMKYGVDVVILEASSKTGGRIAANTSFADIPLELGAEEIHGRKSVLYDLATFHASDRIMEFPGSDYYWLNNQIRDEVYLRESSDLSGAGATMLNILESYGSYPGSEKTLEQYLLDFPLDDRLTNIVNALTGNEYGTSNNHIGMLALKEAEAAYSSGLEGFTFKKGTYWSLFETAFADAINAVELNRIVSEIDYSGTGVVVKTTNGSSYTADKVLVTVPLTMLKNNSIAFSPALPDTKLQAIDAIEMGNGMKVVLSFNAPFWAEDTGSIIGGIKAPEYWISSAEKDSAGNYITAFIMGDSADALALMSEAQVVQELLTELATFYPTGNVQAKYTGVYLLKNWRNEPFIQGAYSYPSINSEGQREHLAAPVNSKLFFAGEATNYNGHLATVHGAMESGYRAVKELLES
jgi:monoamine oxidase